MSVIFEDNSKEVMKIIEDAGIEWLYEASGAIEAQVKRNTKVDTGKTKGSWRYKVDESKLESRIGSNYENAIWEEFGTGLYAVNGNGRKTPWRYKDAKGNWHTTKGKRPKRAFLKAKNSKENEIVEIFKRKLRRLK